MTDEKRADAVEGVRLCGTLVIVIGGAAAVAALVVEGGTPPWQVLAVFGLAAVLGVGLRLEAAIREHGLGGGQGAEGLLGVEGGAGEQEQT